MNFEETEEGQLLIGSHCYISAALHLRMSSTWKTKEGLFQKPVLHLLSHGIELLLKVTPVRRGRPSKDVRDYGHNLLGLWNDQDNALLRNAIYDRGRRAWVDAKNSGLWPADNFAGDPVTAIDKAVADLSKLHGRESDFALRYLVQPNTNAPTPMFLLEVFSDVAERRVMNPALLDV